MALKKHPIVAGLLLALAGSACGGASPAAPEPEEPDPLSVTRWTERTELFAEFPPLIAGRTSRFAIHVTRLDSFAALADGRVEVQLRGGAGAAETFAVDAPGRPGIFGVDVTPASAGPRDLVVRIRAAGLEDEHVVGPVEVHATPDAARAAGAPPGVDGISFLKEQQWSLEFATALVETRALRGSVRVPGRIEPRPGGAAEVTAPVDGRVTWVVDATLGTAVRAGQELARLLPPPAVPADRPALDRAVSEARLRLDLATRDRERAERLTAAGAAPARRLEEARAAESEARVRLTAAEASLAQDEAARSGRAGAGTEFVVRAPIDGVLAGRDAIAGVHVGAGARLFRIVDVSQVHAVGFVAESDAASVRRLADAELELPGAPTRLAAGRRVSVDRVLDPQTRTLGVTFAFDNRTAALPVGQLVFLNLLTDAGAPGPVVPASALVDDAGRPIVFVQAAGETFERRAVTVGVREGGVVRIAAGLRPGERVVTRGAYLVRLASLSTAVPAHGHVH